MAVTFDGVIIGCVQTFDTKMEEKKIIKIKYLPEDNEGGNEG